MQFVFDMFISEVVCHHQQTGKHATLGGTFNQNMMKKKETEHMQHHHTDMIQLLGIYYCCRYRIRITKTSWGRAVPSLCQAGTS